MIRTKTSATMFAGLWFGLAAAQSARGFSTCQDESGWVAAYWGMHAVLLIAPLWAVRRVVGESETPAPRSFDAALGLALLTYVPMTIAMRLLEICTTSR